MSAGVAVGMILFLALAPSLAAAGVELLEYRRARRARQLRARPPRMVALSPRRRRAASAR